MEPGRPWNDKKQKREQQTRSSGRKKCSLEEAKCEDIRSFLADRRELIERWKQPFDEQSRGRKHGGPTQWGKRLRQCNNDIRGRNDPASSLKEFKDALYQHDAAGKNGIDGST